MFENANIPGQNHADDTTNEDKDRQDEVVMESLGDVSPSSADYIEADDDLDAIAEGYR